MGQKGTPYKGISKSEARPILPDNFTRANQNVSGYVPYSPGTMYHYHEKGKGQQMTCQVFR
jgi:hypothetical protein